MWNLYIFVPITKEFVYPEGYHFESEKNWLKEMTWGFFLSPKMVFIFFLTLYSVLERSLSLVQWKSITITLINLIFIFTHLSFYLFYKLLLKKYMRSWILNNNVTEVSMLLLDQYLIYIKINIKCIYIYI